MSQLHHPKLPNVTATVTEATEKEWLAAGWKRPADVSDAAEPGKPDTIEQDSQPGDE